MNNSKWKITTAACLIITSVFASSSLMADDERLGAEELRELIIGNTLTGSYWINGEKITYHEYVSETGRSVFRDPMDTDTASNEFREDGCLFTDYDSSDHSDGCYYYERLSDGSFLISRPGASNPAVQHILEGDPEDLAKHLDEKDPTAKEI